MAKTYRSNLPKVISKANRDISTIIESDIASEARLLQELVNQVRDANLEVKKNNNQRITETKRKLNELDKEISNLNSSIDLVDRETVIQQLNEMIDAENKIFAARQEVRFFDNKKTPERILTYDSIYEELVSSVDMLNEQEDMFRNKVLGSNQLLFDKQIEVTNEIITLMDNLFDSKRDFITNEIKSMTGIYDNVKVLEDEFNSYIKESIDNCYALGLDSGSVFKEVEDDENIEEKIKLDYENKLLEIHKNIEASELKFKNKKEEIELAYDKYVQNLSTKQEINNEKFLAVEKEQKKAIDKKLKNIRLQIMDAEKKNELSKASKLMKEFDRVEKSTSSLKVTTKLSKELSASTKKAHIKSLNSLLAIEKKHLSEINKQNQNLSLEKIKYEESKILYKIKSDYNGLLDDVDINKDRVSNLKEYLDTKVKTGRKIIKLKEEIRLKELSMMKENELEELSLVDTFKNFLSELKEIEALRIKTLKQNIDSYKLIKIEQEYLARKSIEDTKLDQNLNDIDKLILSRRNETLIKNEKIKEEANSEIIYQESLINIARKEHELQLIKVESLYENERTLAEEQIERINLGIKVNDVFVKTTLENQLLFATQQIKCAQSEYEIRIESINLTLNQELDYAHKKIDYYKQKYEYEKSKLRKELEDKLEDLNYKLLLFTDEKDNRKIVSKIKKLEDSYNRMIEEIEEVENKDVEILRYDKVIRDANNRAESAILEAGSLRDQTVDSFEALYFQTKQKFDQLEQTDKSNGNIGIMPLLNNTVISSADDRLKKAKREADELYAEKIIKPTQVIEKTKELLENMTNSKESDIYIEKQKELKHKKIDEHKEICDNLLRIKNESLKNINEEIEQISESKEVESKIIDTSEFTDMIDSDKASIEKDYEELAQKETNIHKDLVKQLTQYRTEYITKLDQIVKDNHEMIKVTSIPYKKYIKFASKGLTAKKKVLVKEYSKKLKRLHSDADSRYKKMLNEL